MKITRRRLISAMPSAAVAPRVPPTPPPSDRNRRLRRSGPAASRRVKEIVHTAGLVIVGGGLAGTCAAVTAARAGLKVVLIQDRPILGGNASSEVRLWILGATAHMGNNNRWAREGGVVDEILVENMHRNPEGNPLIVDSILLEKVREEPNITLLLNTSVYEVEKADEDTISGVRGYCAQNETSYVARAPLFLDSSGDGVLGFLAGAAFRMGAESSQEFGEGFAPSKEYGDLLGHSLYFYSRDTGKPVKYVAPSFALKDITKIPHWRSLRPTDSGCRLWWLEWGGRLDTVHDTEEIKWELWKVAYGVWDYIKNSGRFPEAETLMLEWIGLFPGKRESRRFEGLYILTQRDVVEQHRHHDAVSFGGWAIDLHPADGVYSKLPSCTQWHAKGIYQIPYRCMVSRNIRNLFLAGRIVSVSHVAFGSTRVMATCASGGQAVAMAAVLCRRHNLLPADIARPEHARELQRELLRTGQYIPGVRLVDPADLVGKASITASSRFVLDNLPPNGQTQPLDVSRAMMLPVPAGPMPAVTLRFDATTSTTVEAELRVSSIRGNFTPDDVRRRQSFPLKPGRDQEVRLVFQEYIAKPQYVFICLRKNPAVSVHLTGQRITGVLSLRHSRTQKPPAKLGIETFELWPASRRPGGQNFALAVDPPLDVFGPRNVVNGFARPYLQPNAWVASPSDPKPRLTLRWPSPQTIVRVDLSFDTDFDHPMESVLMGHPERDMPFCIRHYRIRDAVGRILHEEEDNHQSLNRIRLDQPVTTDGLHIEVLGTHGAPAALFAFRCYAKAT